MKKYNVSLKDFATNFWDQVKKSTDLQFETFLSTIKECYTSSNFRTGNFIDNSQISIYFPYMEEFIDPINGGGTYTPIVSLTTATADADEGWGEQPYYINGVLQYYTSVLINDAYAELNPTHIIGLNGIEPYNEPTTPNVAFPPTDPIDLPNLPREVRKIYIGDVRCIKQYDALISFTNNGGGSEIVFTGVNGFLKLADGQVQADNFFTPPHTISRHNINKRNWVDFSYEWDGDWELLNLQQNPAIYEEDNRNSSSVTGSISTTAVVTMTPVVITAARSLGFTLNFKSDDALIRQINLNSDVFFILNRTNLEGEMKNGWPVRDKNANVSYTLNDRTYY